jgi:hypothetical protein
MCPESATRAIGDASGPPQQSTEHGPKLTISSRQYRMSIAQVTTFASPPHLSQATRSTSSLPIKSLNVVVLSRGMDSFRSQRANPSRRPVNNFIGPFFASPIVSWQVSERTTF